jgi:hypothetical protein
MSLGEAELFRVRFHNAFTRVRSFKQDIEPLLNLTEATSSCCRAGAIISITLAGGSTCAQRMHESVLVYTAGFFTVYYSIIPVADGFQQ